MDRVYSFVLKIHHRDILDMDIAEDVYQLRSQVGFWTMEWLDESKFAFDKGDCNSVYVCYAFIGYLHSA